MLWPLQEALKLFPGGVFLREAEDFLSFQTLALCFPPRCQGPALAAVTSPFPIWNASAPQGQKQPGKKKRAGNGAEEKADRHLQSPLCWRKEWAGGGTPKPQPSSIPREAAIVGSCSVRRRHNSCWKAAWHSCVNHSPASQQPAFPSGCLQAPVQVLFFPQIFLQHLPVTAQLSPRCPLKRAATASFLGWPAPKAASLPRHKGGQWHRITQPLCLPPSHWSKNRFLSGLSWTFSVSPLHPALPPSSWGTTLNSHLSLHHVTIWDLNRTYMF